MRLRLERRPVPGVWIGAAVRAASVLLGLGAACLFVLAAGADPRRALVEMASGSFGSWAAIQGTLLKAVPLMLCALGLAPAYRMNLWNIGAEGQLHVGAAAAAWFALARPGAPAWEVLPAMMLLAMLGGGMWCLVAGALKAYLSVNEIIVTLMLNYVAILGVEFLIYGPWKDPRTFGFPLTPVFGDGAALPVIPGTRLHLGLAVALAAAAILHLVIRQTRFGFELRVMGRNLRAARYSGMNIRRAALAVMLLSGAMAGLAGMVEIAGLHHRLQPGFSPGYGFTAIIVAWLAGLHPLAIPPVAVLFGGLLTGGDLIQITLKLPLSLVNVLQGLVLFFVLAGEFLRNFRLRPVRGGAGHA